jgi:hypothetical protein
MGKQFTPIWFHQGLERHLITRMSSNDQGRLGWGFLCSPSSSYHFLSDPVMLTMKCTSKPQDWGKQVILENQDF